MLKLNFDKIKIIFILVLVILNSGYALSLGYQSEIMMLSILFIVGDVFVSRRILKVTKNSLVFFVLMLSQFALAFAVNLDIVGICRLADKHRPHLINRYACSTEQQVAKGRHKE